MGEKIAVNDKKLFLTSYNANQPPELQVSLDSNMVPRPLQDFFEFDPNSEESFAILSLLREHLERHKPEDPELSHVGVKLPEFRQFLKRTG